MSGVEQMETTVGGAQSGSWLHVLLAAGNQTRRVPTLLQTRNPDAWVHQKGTTRRDGLILELFFSLSVLTRFHPVGLLFF